MPLTDTKLRQAKPREKLYKLYDEKGLFVEVTPSGSKRWRFKYRIDNKEKLISLGIYPDVSLKDARERRDESRKLLANQVDPSENRKAIRSSRALQLSNSFEAIAREWWKKFSTEWTDDHKVRVLRRFENNIFPLIGQEPISELTAPRVLNAIRIIEGRGALESAHRALGDCGRVFRYAVATGKAERDPTNDLKGALPPIRRTHFPSITDPKQVGRLLSIMDDYQGTYVVKAALNLAPLVFVRPGELRRAEWKDMQLDEPAQWSYLVTKTQVEHVVPLSKQAVQILKDLYLLTGRGKYVFPSARSSQKPMSENAINAAFRSMGIPKEEMCGHGFRAMARTILDEVLNVRPDYIEHQLAHAVRDPNGRAYNRTAHLEERRKMMQQWADYLNALKSL